MKYPKQALCILQGQGYIRAQKGFKLDRRYCSYSRALLFSVSSTNGYIRYYCYDRRNGLHRAEVAGRSLIKVDRKNVSKLKYQLVQ